VTIVPKAGWHVNKAYPWKVKAGDSVVADKTKFSLSETQASVTPPKGATSIKGGICSGDKCLSIDVKVPAK
jgi:hypothetical protein